MIIRNINRLSILTVLAMSCGVDKGLHYRDPKDFGEQVSPEAEDKEQEQAPVAQPRPQSDTRPSTKPVPRPTENVTDETPVETTIHTDPIPDVNNQPIPNENDTGEEVQVHRPDPNTVITNSVFRSYIDKDSIRKLYNGDGIGGEPPETLNFVQEYLADYLPTNPMANTVRLMATLGDAQGNSLGIQQIRASMGELNRMLSKPADSGTQTYQRVMEDQEKCPGVFICAKGTTFSPDDGDPETYDGEDMTYCYYDMESDKSVPMPMAPAPNYKIEDIEPYLNSYGPYRVRKIRGKVVDCSSAESEVIDMQSVIVRIRKGYEGSAVALNLHYNNALAVDHEIEFEIERAYGGVNRTPYLDETVRLQGKTRYFINVEKKKFVKIIKTIRKSLIIPQDGGEDLWTSWGIDLLNGVVQFDGIMMDVHFELCDDELNPAAPTNYCN